MRRNDVASTSFRRRVPIRFLINQCQIITFLILRYDIIENSRIELRGIVLPVQMGGLLGGPKGMLPPLSNYWGPPPPPLFLSLSSYAYACNLRSNNKSKMEISKFALQCPSPAVHMYRPNRAYLVTSFFVFLSCSLKAATVAFFLGQKAPFLRLIIMIIITDSLIKILTLKDIRPHIFVLNFKFLTKKYPRHILK